MAIAELAALNATGGDMGLLWRDGSRSKWQLARALGEALKGRTFDQKSAKKALLFTEGKVNGQHGGAGLDWVELDSKGTIKRGKEGLSVLGVLKTHLQGRVVTESEAQKLLSTVKIRFNNSGLSAAKVATVKKVETVKKSEQVKPKGKVAVKKVGKVTTSKGKK